jgi:hypothetical protein
MKGFLTYCNEYQLITPQRRNSSRKIIFYQEKDEWGGGRVNSEGKRET